MRQRRLPPLSTLRGFDAAARHLSFTKAAEELHLTQGAVSRQIKELEQHLGVPLFKRLTRQILLTAEGEQYFRIVEEMMDELEQASVRLSGRGEPAKLRVSVLPTIAATWLMPRLHGFNSRHPEVELRIVSSIEPADLHTPEADLAIRVGRLPGRHYDRLQPRIDLTMLTRWDGANAYELFADRLTPVAAPGYLPAGALTPATLLSLPLIHTTTRRHAWPDWLRAQGVRGKAPVEPALQFGHFFLSLDAARQGRGVAIVPDIFLAGADGLRGLARPEVSAVRSAGEYYLLIHEGRLEDPHVRKFREWVLAEAEGMGAPA